MAGINPAFDDQSSVRVLHDVLVEIARAPDHQYPDREQDGQGQNDFHRPLSSIARKRKLALWLINLFPAVSLSHSRYRRSGASILVAAARLPLPYPSSAICE